MNINELAEKLAPFLLEYVMDETECAINKILSENRCGYLVKLAYYSTDCENVIGLYILEQQNQTARMYIIKIEGDSVSIEETNCFPNIVPLFELISSNLCECNDISSDPCEKPECYLKNKCYDFPSLSTSSDCHNNHEEDYDHGRYPLSSSSSCDHECKEKHRPRNKCSNPGNCYESSSCSSSDDRVHRIEVVHVNKPRNSTKKVKRSKKRSKPVKHHKYVPPSSFSSSSCSLSSSSSSSPSCPSSSSSCSSSSSSSCSLSSSSSCPSYSEKKHKPKKKHSKPTKPHKPSKKKRNKHKQETCCKQDDCCKREKCRKTNKKSCEPKTKHKKDKCCKSKKRCCDGQLTNDGKQCCPGDPCYLNEVACPLASTCDICEELKQIVGFLGRRACNAQIFKCCVPVDGEPGCEKFACCLYVRVDRRGTFPVYMEQVHGVEGETLKDTDSDIGHNLISYPLSTILEVENFAGISYLLACLDKIIRRDSCNEYTFVDVCRTVCKSSLVCVGYDDCKNTEYRWIDEVNNREGVACVNVKEISIIDLCACYKSFFHD